MQNIELWIAIIGVFLTVGGVFAKFIHDNAVKEQQIKELSTYKEDSKKELSTLKEDCKKEISDLKDKYNSFSTDLRVAKETFNNFTNIQEKHEKDMSEIKTQNMQILEKLGEINGKLSNFNHKRSE